MSLLSNKATPAERMRGCQIALDLDSADAVVAAGGTITGTPVFKGPRKGIELDGINDYLAYDLMGDEFSSDELSIVCEFTPDFDPDDGFGYRLIGAATNEVSIYKSTADNLILYVNGGAVLLAAIGDFGDYWRRGEKNLIVATTTSGAHVLYLNGVTVDTGVSASSSISISQFGVGASPVGLNPFLGTIHNVKVFNQLLTAQEAKDYYTNETYKYREKSSIFLKMDMASHSPTEVRTLDASKNDNHAILGAGDGGATTPTKISYERGYDFDGADYMVAPFIFNEPAVSFVMEFSPDFDPDDNADRHFFSSTTFTYRVFKRRNAFNNTIYFTMGTTGLGLGVTQANYENIWKTGRRNIMTITSTTGDTKVWLNGVRIYTNATAWSSADVTEAFVGVNSDLSQPFDGKIHTFAAFPIMLTELQVKDIEHRLKLEASHV